MAGSARTGRSRHWFTIAEAANRSGVSADTVRRRLRAGAFPSAAPPDGESAAWLIPVGDLIAAGLTAGAPARTTGASGNGAPDGRLELLVEAPGHQKGRARRQRVRGRAAHARGAPAQAHQRRRRLAGRPVLGAAHRPTAGSGDHDPDRRLQNVGMLTRQAADALLDALLP